MTVSNQTMMVRDYPLEERPRERMVKDGAEKLSNQELLAILLRTGTNQESVFSLATRIIKEIGSVRRLSEASVDELTKIKGIGLAKAVQIKAGIELGRRVAVKREALISIRSPQEAAKYLMELLKLDQQEKFYVLYLDTKNQIVYEKAVFVGSLNASIVHPREVFKEAVKWSSASIIVAHNHPSGDPDPSREDIEVTKRLVSAGEIMGIDLLDHIVIGDGRYVSLKEKGYM
ncbi:RadC family protein [Bacillus horti]|uniref:DNA repair protein RadC n=1 Tax=Caldalkalibacillus horti TaxID=77523 RepID=A0ABT9VTH6_9BACI|nr:DNA repair protein RadC [Bacillus horti]MDQ0164291.1 DNA repair protein RadC [Bacillus horti]